MITPLKLQKDQPTEKEDRLRSEVDRLNLENNQTDLDENLLLTQINPSGVE